MTVRARMCAQFNGNTHTFVYVAHTPSLFQMRCVCLSSVRGSCIHNIGVCLCMCVSYAQIHERHRRHHHRPMCSMSTVIIRTHPLERQTVRTSARCPVYALQLDALPARALHVHVIISACTRCTQTNMSVCAFVHVRMCNSMCERKTSQLYIANTVNLCGFRMALGTVGALRICARDANRVRCEHHDHICNRVRARAVLTRHAIIG